VFRPAKLAIGWRSERSSIFSSMSAPRLRDAPRIDQELEAAAAPADAPMSEDGSSSRALAFRPRTI